MPCVHCIYIIIFSLKDSGLFILFRFVYIVYHCLSTDKPVHPPKFIRSPSDLVVNEGDDAVFECELSPLPDLSTQPGEKGAAEGLNGETNIRWFKDDDEIPLDVPEFAQTFDGRVARLSISETYVDDAAVYRCVVRTPAGEDGVTAKLVVNGKYFETFM